MSRSDRRKRGIMRRGTLTDDALYPLSPSQGIIIVQQPKLICLSARKLRLPSTKSKTSDGFAAIQADRMDE